MKKRNQFIRISTFLVAMILLANNIFASANIFFYSFSGTVGYNYARVSKDINKETNSPSGIQWQTTSLSKHTILFGIWDENRNEWRRKTIKFDSASDLGKEFEITNTSTRNGGKYSLWASREKLFQSKAYITGTWRP